MEKIFHLSIKATDNCNKLLVPLTFGLLYNVSLREFNAKLFCFFLPLRQIYGVCNAIFRAFKKLAISSFCDIKPDKNY